MQSIVDGLIVLAIVYALGNFIHGMIIAYQWLTCINHM